MVHRVKKQWRKSKWNLRAMLIWFYAWEILLDMSEKELMDLKVYMKEIVSMKKIWKNCSGENRTKIDFELIGRKDRKHLKDVKAIRDIGTFVACTHSSDLNERKLKNKDVQSNFE